jgi:hypothetical protein
MTPSAFAGAIEIRCPVRLISALKIGTVLRNLIERLILNHRAKCAGREFEQLDGRILKDIGFTRLGVREAALMNRNELNT